MAVKIELGRRYRFAASHRLHTKKLSEEENTRIFGKCANPYGHGHNYVLEISVSGDIDPATGMIANFADLDSFVEHEVIEVFDCRSLNEDGAACRQTVPTTENLCAEIFARVQSLRKAHVAYLPSKKVIGLSKVARLVNMFARRLQIQERMTSQIAKALEEKIAPQGVGVIIEARHLCMQMRGVEKQHGQAVTSAMLGAFRHNKQTRDEFLALIRPRKS